MVYQSSTRYFDFPDRFHVAYSDDLLNWTKVDNTKPFSNAETQNNGTKEEFGLAKCLNTTICFICITKDGAVKDGFRIEMRFISGTDTRAPAAPRYRKMNS